MRWFLQPHLIFVAFVLLTSLPGCVKKYSVDTGRDKAQLALFIQGFPQQGEETQLLKVYQAKPKLVYIDPKPVMRGDSGMITLSKVIDTQDGLHAIQLDFTTLGQSVMEHITTNFRSRQLYIVLATNDDHSKTNKVKMTCIGSHYINQTFSTPLVFTPDASRDESEKITKLLNNTLKDY